MEETRAFRTLPALKEIRSSAAFAQLVEESEQAYLGHDLDEIKALPRKWNRADKDYTGALVFAIYGSGSSQGDGCFIYSVLGGEAQPVLGTNKEVAPGSLTRHLLSALLS